MAKLNRLDISGKIISEISKTEKQVSFTVRQRLAKNVFLTFEVRAFKEAAKRFDETGLKKDDLVFIVGAMIYQEKGNLIVKVKNLSQLWNMSGRKEALDLGTERFA